MISIAEAYKTTDEKCAEMLGINVEEYKEMKIKMLGSQKPLKEFFDSIKRN